MYELHRKYAIKFQFVNSEESEREVKKYNRIEQNKYDEYIKRTSNTTDYTVQKRKLQSAVKVS